MRMVQTGIELRQESDAQSEQLAANIISAEQEQVGEEQREEYVREIQRGIEARQESEELTADMIQLQEQVVLDFTQARLELRRDEGVVAAEDSDHTGDDEDNPEDVSIID